MTSRIDRQLRSTALTDRPIKTVLDAFAFQIAVEEWSHTEVAKDFYRLVWHQPDAANLSVIRWPAESGATYFWSADICDLINASANSMPAYTLATSNVPSERAFMVFEKPLIVAADEAAGMEECQIRALCWLAIYPDEFPNRAYSPDEGAEGATELRFAAIGRQGDAPDIRLLHPVLDGRWPVGATQDNSNWAKFLRDATAPAEGSQVLVNCLAACLSFLDQPYIANTESRLDRAGRRRLASGKPEPILRTITLRRASRDTSERQEPSEDLEWSCRWISGVTGANNGTHQSVFINRSGFCPM